MVLQPRGQGFSFAIRQQIDATSAFQITQDRAVMAAFAPRPVIDPKHPGCRRWFQANLAEAAQQRRCADWHARPACQACPRIGAQRQGDPLVEGPETIGMAGSGASHVQQRLAKGSPRTGAVDAPEAPNLDKEDDWAPEAR